MEPQDERKSAARFHTHRQFADCAFLQAHEFREFLKEGGKRHVLVPMNLRFFFSLLLKLPAAIFGRWTPPGWLLGLGRFIAKRPRALLGLMCAIIGLGYGGWQWWLWHEAHKPHPRELASVRRIAAKLIAPSLSLDSTTKAPSVTPLGIRFDGDAAPLGWNEAKNVEPIASNAPAVDGKWRWTSASSASFTPEKPWPAGIEYRIQFKSARLAPHTELVATSVSFTTERLTARLTDASFYTAPDEPTRHQAIASLTFNQPVAIETVRAQLSISSVGGGGIFAQGSDIEVTQSAHTPLTFHIRSPRIVIPKDEDFVKIVLQPGALAVAGGAPMADELSTKITVPTRASGFSISKFTASLVPADDGEPRQFLFVETNVAADSKVIAKALSVWPLPARDEEWTQADVTADVLEKLKPLALELVEEDETQTFAKRFAFRLPPIPGCTAFVRIPAGTVSVGGFELGSDYRQPVTIPAFPKEAKIIGEGGVLALTGERKLTVKSRGYESLRFTLGRVPAGQINHLVSQTEGEFQSPEFRGRFGQENISRFHRQTQHIAKRSDHEASYSAFDFSAQLASADASDPEPSRGLFFVEIQGVRKRTEDDGAPNKNDPDADWIAVDSSGKDVAFEDEDEDAADQRFLLVTDLGLIVKRNADGSRDVFVQSFAKRDPVVGVRISVLAKNGESLAEAQTDEQGHAALPTLDGLKRERKPVSIVARHGSDLAFIPWERNDRKLELTRFDIEGVNQSEATSLDASVFTERGIYRPGDPIRVCAIVRQRDWNGSLDGIPVELKVTNAKEEDAGIFPAKLNSLGFIEFEVPTAETSPTGVWRVELRRGGAPAKNKREDDEEETSFLGQTLVRVEDFQPDRMKMETTLEPSAKLGWIKPDAVSVRADVQTLFGIAAAERRVTASLNVSATPPHFESWPGWRFHLPESERFESVTVPLTEQKSDAKGAVSFPLALSQYASPLLALNVELEAFEPDGGRGVRGAVQALVSPRDWLVGVKTDGDLGFIGKDVPAKIRVMAIAPDLRPVAVQGLKRSLIETRHVSVLTTRDNGTVAYVSRQKDRELESVAADLPAAETEVALPTNTAGRFRYEWRDAAGARVCTVPFTVVGPGNPGRNLERDNELEVSLPSREFRPGAELQVSLRAPYTGGGLMTIERERVLGWKWFKADNASSVQSMKIPDGIEGSAYVNIACVRGLDSPEIFTNPLSVGVSPFRVTPEQRKFGVTLDVPQRVQPGELLKIGYRCDKPSRVVLWAVDEGIHRVTNYKLPDPLALFFRQRALEVGTWQLMDLLLPEYSMLKQSKAYGGDGGEEAPELNLGMNPFKRRKAAPVVFWSGIVEGGPERREVNYTVPDYFAGRLNIMATAVALDAVGTSQSATIVKGPFVLTPNAPLFVAPGDEFTASLTVANQTEGADATGSVAISAESIGGLEILDSPKQEVAIPVNTESPVRFRVRVTPALGNAELRFTASAGNQRVEVRSTMSIRPTTPFVTSVQSGWFRRDAHEIKVGRSLLPEFSKREAVASTTPLGLNRGLEAYLDQYPHGCSEQITSKAFPWIVADDKVRAREAVKHAIGKLAQRQGADGGFGYWTSGDVGAGFDYVSIYVAHFLTEAKAAGFEVPASIHDGMLKRLKAMAAIAKVNSRHDASVQSAAIYLLTRHGIVTTNYALNLRDSLTQISKDEWVGDNSAAWLAATLRLLKKDDEAMKLITAHWKALRESKAVDSARFYESPLSRSAQSFVVICRHFPEIAGTFGYDDLRLVTEPIGDGRFHTLGAAWSVLAIRAYADLATESGIKVGISETGAIAKNFAPPGIGLVTGKFTPEATALQFSLSRPDGAPDLGAWYQVLEAGFGKSVPTVAETKGLEVTRLFGTEPGAPVLAKVGDTLRMRVRVRNVNALAQTHIAVNDLFPAGFDIAPDSLKPGLGSAGAEYVDVREDRALFFTSLRPGESKTFDYSMRATCAGTFAVPPPFAENMYDRAIHGTGVAATVTVAPRQ